MNAIIHKTRFVSLVGVLFVSAFGLPQSGLADSYEATDSGNWSSPKIWTPSGLPGIEDTATIGNRYTVTVTDARWISRLNLSIASDSAGRLIVEAGGSLTAGSFVHLATAAGADGSLTINTSGTLVSIFSDGLVVGYSDGSAELNINGGSVISAGTASIGNFGVASGTVNVTAGGWTGASGLYLGRDKGATGALNISGGRVDGGNVTIGVNEGGSGSVTVQGSGTLITNTLIVGNGGSGMLNLAGGSLSSAGVVVGSEAATGSGVMVVRGGTVTSGSMTLGGTGTGALDLTGGELAVGEALYVASAPGSSGTLNFGTGGTVGMLTTGAEGVIGGRGTAAVHFNHTVHHVNSLRFRGSLAVKQIGTGTTTLDGITSYVGETSVSDGVLLIGANGALSDTSRVGVSGGKFEISASNRVNDGAALTLSGGTFATGGFSETLAELTLADATTSHLDLGSGNSILLFSGITGGKGVLAITNWTKGQDSLRFTSDQNLSADSFRVNGGAAAIVNHGSYHEIVGASPASVSTQ